MNQVANQSVVYVKESYLLDKMLIYDGEKYLWGLKCFYEWNDKVNIKISLKLFLLVKQSLFMLNEKSHRTLCSKQPS